MSHPRLTIGTYGEITTRRLPSGRLEARTRYRDWDGVARLVQASAESTAAATRALKAKCAERNLLAPTTGTLAPDSPDERSRIPGLMGLPKGRSCICAVRKTCRASQVRLSPRPVRQS